MRAAGMAACASAAGRVQALTTGMLADLRELEQRHDEQVLGDLLRLDHCTAQAGRLADSVAVLTGSRSGRRWTKPIVTESVLRGAMGRIHAYQRVRLHSATDLAVAGHAAEGVMHALAELMDNACNFSPPTEYVHVYVQETNAGLVVIIEDAGLSMPDATLVRAEKLVSGDPLDVRSLSGTRLGARGGGVPGPQVRPHRVLPAVLAGRYGRGGADPREDRGAGAGGARRTGGTGRVRHVPGGRRRAVPRAGHAGAGAGGTVPTARRTGAASAPEVPPWPREHSPAHARPAADRPRVRACRRARSCRPSPRARPRGTRPGPPARCRGTRRARARPPYPVRPFTPAPLRPRPPARLPKRSRGQTLAAGRHDDLTADPSASWLDPSPEEEARAARARAAAGARFSAFREAATGGVRTGGRGRADRGAAEHAAARSDDAAGRPYDRGPYGAGRTTDGSAGDLAGDGPAARAGSGAEGGRERGRGEQAGAGDGPRDLTPLAQTPAEGTDTVSAGGDTGR